MTDMTLRAARADEDDERFLWEMLIEAMSWRPGSPRLTVADARANPHIARYVQGWGRSGDAGTIAELIGRPVGAAWWRFFTADDHGYGFIAAEAPEVSIAVADEHRGRGVGTALLTALVARAGEQGLSALSLSVEFENPALRLYERLGFTTVRR
ncbi:MAG TPA: GNAT family N-acetyltransferase, partial [Mycobacterium sp.]